MPSDKSKRSVSRRRVFQTIGVASAGATAAAVLAACGAPPAPTTAPVAAATAAPAKSTEAPKPAAEAPKPAAPAATAPTAAASAPAASAATKPADPAKPADAAKPAAAKPGAVSLPEVIVDVSKAPKTFKESPLVAQLVKDGKLPAVEKRLPEEPLVLKPANEIGKYGGTWRAVFTGPGDEQNAQRISHDHFVYWDPKVEKIVPHIAKSWTIEDGGKAIVFELRKGMKWSDGTPFNADDIMFWYEDIYMNNDITPTKASFMSIKGKQGVVTKVSDTSVRFSFEAPYYMFLDLIASLGAAGHFTQGKNGLGIYAPKEYLKQFLPKYSSLDAVTAKAKDAKYDNWVLYFKQQTNALRNMACPVLTPWKPTSPITGPSLVLERNPFYFAVDTDGNQLPYIDKLSMGLAENLEIANLRAIAGEYDLQIRHMDIAKVPAFKENEKKNNYTLNFWEWPHGSDAGLFVNQNYDADPEIRKWLTSKDFRIALSLGIDRNQLNETFWIGLGEPGGPAPASNTTYSPGPQYRTLNSTLDIKRANEMLDKMGLDKKDAAGLRLRTDGKGVLVLDVVTVGAAFVNWTGITEMVGQQWLKIGIKANVQQIERTLMESRLRANELQIRVWSNDGSDNPFTYPDHAMAFNEGSAIGPMSGKWFQSGGSQGVKPEGDLLKQLELFEQAKSTPASERVALGKEITRLMAENLWVIGTVGVSPALLGIAIISNKLGNVPAQVPGSTPGQTPGNARPEQFYFKT